jgi:hypothetical protein
MGWSLFLALPEAGTKSRWISPQKLIQSRAVTESNHTCCRSPRPGWLAVVCVHLQPGGALSLFGTANTGVFGSLGYSDSPSLLNYAHLNYAELRFFALFGRPGVLGVAE